MARALVIGGTLFIGRALVDQLLARGDDVVIMHRGTGTPFGTRVGEIQCDRNDVAAVQAALANSGPRPLRLPLYAAMSSRRASRCTEKEANTTRTLSSSRQIIRTHTAYKRQRANEPCSTRTGETAFA